MATAKKAAAQATPSQTFREIMESAPERRSLEIPADDPGPPTPFPVAENEAFQAGYASSLATQLIAQAGHKKDLEAVRAISTMRLHPAVARFKAEVVHWLRNQPK